MKKKLMSTTETHIPEYPGPGEILPRVAEKKHLPEKVHPHKKGTSLVFKANKNGKIEDTISFSDGETYSIDNIKNLGSQLFQKLDGVCKETSGSEDLEVTLRVLGQIQRGMVGDEFHDRMNSVSETLPLLQPRDTTEALLAGQFANLQRAGFKCLQNGINSDMLTQAEFYYNQASKLLRLANETMQTLVRYRTAGQQVVQVVHMTNNGQAIVAQNLSHNPTGGGVPTQN